MRGLVVFLCYQVDSVINNINLNLTKVTITYLSKTLISIFQSTYICRKLNKCINEIFRSLSEVRIVFNFKIRTAILYSFRIIDNWLCGLCKKSFLRNTVDKLIFLTQSDIIRKSSIKSKCHHRTRCFAHAMSFHVSKSTMRQNKRCIYLNYDLLVRIVNVYESNKNMRCI